MGTLANMHQAKGQERNDILCLDVGYTGRSIESMRELDLCLPLAKFRAYQNVFCVLGDWVGPTSLESRLWMNLK